MGCICMRGKMVQSVCVKMPQGVKLVLFNSYENMFYKHWWWFYQHQLLLRGLFRHFLLMRDCQEELKHLPQLPLHMTFLFRWKTKIKRPACLPTVQQNQANWGKTGGHRKLLLSWYSCSVYNTRLWICHLDISNCTSANTLRLHTSARALWARCHRRFSQ